MHTLLSDTNCPQTFQPILKVWSKTVPRIQSLVPEHQHDLARIICGLDPVSQPLNPDLNKIAAELRAIAIEISQRRSFQERYAIDLQIALDAGETYPSAGEKRVTASFKPPPSYDEGLTNDSLERARNNPTAQSSQPMLSLSSSSSGIN